jgi:outer membrane lipoprotein-sorting protein
MHKTLGRFAVLAALSVVFCLGSAMQTNGQRVIGEVLKRMNDHNKALQSLKADVTMVKYESALKVSDIMVGEVLYFAETKDVKPKMRVEWKSSNGKTSNDSFAVDGDKFTMFQPGINQVTVGTIPKGKQSNKMTSAFGFVGTSSEQLRANYLVDYLGEEQVKSGATTYHLGLTPKVNVSFKSAELWVDADGMPLQAKIVEKNNDSTTVLLSNLKKNLTVRLSEFEIRYDKKKVKIAKM